MEKEDATKTFFSALAEVSSKKAGPKSALAQAANDAVNDPSPAAFVRTQEELARLCDDLRDQILSDVHARMRNDVSLIWDNLPNAPTSGRPN